MGFMGGWIMVGRFIMCWLIVLTTFVGATDDNHVRVQCGYTRYPSLCLKTLTGLGNRQVDVLSALLNSTISLTTLPVSNFESLSSRFVSSEAQLARQSIGYCHEMTRMSSQRLNLAMAALNESPVKNKADIQTWISAAITFQQTCKDSADHHAASNEFTAQISRSMEYHSRLASNALALVNRITKNPENPEAIKTERHLSEDTRFPSWVSARDRKILESPASETIEANAVVAKDGSGNFKTVSEAIAAASGGRFVIFVKSGVYKEKIRTNKDGITLIGEGKYSTIITGDSSVGGGTSLTGSATFAISGDGFIAKDIGFENTAGPEKHQAVALIVSSDHSVLFRCSIAGYQDTLYALSLRQFYRECDIYGTIDFIFGNAAAVFQSCQLVFRKPRSGGAYNVILANGRSDPGQNTGFSVQNCRITVGSDVSHSYDSFLGRPWKQYSRAVVMQSNIDGAIASRGWVEWPGASGSTLKTLYFAEYANMGPGAGLGGRVGWPGFHAIGKDEAEKFTVANLISGTSWLPSTGVTFVSGL